MAAAAAATISAGSEAIVGRGKRADRQPLALGGPLPAPVHGPVLVIGQQHLAGRVQRQRRRHDVHGRAHVGGEHEAARIAAQERGQALPRRPQERRAAAQEEIHRLLGETAAQLRDALEHRARQGPNEPVLRLVDEGSSIIRSRAAVQKGEGMTGFQGRREAYHGRI